MISYLNRALLKEFNFFSDEVKLKITRAVRDADGRIDSRMGYTGDIIAEYVIVCDLRDKDEAVDFVNRMDNRGYIFKGVYLRCQFKNGGSPYYMFLAGRHPHRGNDYIMVREDVLEKHLLGEQLIDVSKYAFRVKAGWRVVDKSEQISLMMCAESVYVDEYKNKIQ